ncbi:DUF3152 domain-containing protein [Solwaraspora sp. WMMD1047]|uniref:DUF3152 domain-containing protein n=1 Tax=Solwaraspora sp. WMMD1047 TaxID=3016102 RepID=UPI00241599D2|nr:DUF3152 domain-containing protein [Solwaraspora sp. WMMD1047]MDG4828367.1 DUF3152 domain-containing protein [Solwaraspora sp. WMMD1047]
MTLSTRRRRRRQRALMACLLLASAGLVALDLVGHSEARQQPDRVAHPTPERGATTPAIAPAAEPPSVAPPAVPTSGQAAQRPAPADRPPPTYPETGAGDFGYATGQSAVLGRAGTLRRYRVAVERGIDQDPAGFAGTVDGILGHPDGWTASGELRLRRVPRVASAEFTVFLATPGTSERICATGGLRTERFTNCRLPGQVIINAARWFGAVPGYGAPVEVYQAYAINHEVGHQLGHGHEACPGAGRPAPVMQQQTYGLHGCRAYAWPYRAGRRYAGPAVG